MWSFFMTKSSALVRCLIRDIFCLFKSSSQLAVITCNAHTYPSIHPSINPSIHSETCSYHKNGFAFQIKICNAPRPLLYLTDIDSIRIQVNIKSIPTNIDFQSLILLSCFHLLKSLSSMITYFRTLTFLKELMIRQGRMPSIGKKWRLAKRETNFTTIWTLTTGTAIRHRQDWSLKIKMLRTLTLEKLMRIAQEKVQWFGSVTRQIWTVIKILARVIRRRETSQNAVSLNACEFTITH